VSETGEGFRYDVADGDKDLGSRKETQFRQQFSVSLIAWYIRKPRRVAFQKRAGQDSIPDD
jgi:hypothetical protein